MDIRAKAVADTGVLELKDANGDPLLDGDKPVTITLYSPGSKAYGAANSARQSLLMDRLKKRNKAKVDDADMAAVQAEFLADCTHSMQNIDYEEDGKKLEGRELFVAVYGDRSIGFIAEQAGLFIGEWGNFTKGSAKS